ncbi:matrixin family metalloprotease [Psychromicrobium lacuslunae]|uniref:Peptidase M10 metallopeptidase domain-containing protein n=1 Tax=Psychromicrobium lacuslunae TaxID=1618207 RepID=A0A0D4BW52_9MICC|nr:matrixin family metalloprotease [Psychromicrobium lacuslunae]AJT40356.1 hypothetical protein UM93_00095 [Psychromicrobium lacuslunae]
MKTLVRPLGAAAVALVLLIGGTSTAQAYHLQGPKLSTSSPTFSIDSGSSASRTAWTSGISDWNDASAGVSLSTTSGTGTATLGDANDSSVGWDGITYYSWNNNTNIVTDVSAYLNVAYTASYDAAKRKGVAAHEIGHVLGLDHTSSCVLMNPTTPDRTDCGVSTPQSDDVNGVRSLYATNNFSEQESRPATTGHTVMHLSQAKTFNSLKSLHQGADAVVLATVGSKSESIKNGIPFTDHQLKVLRWLKGGSADGTATIHQTGGTVNGELIQDELEPLLQQGQTGIYFLHQYAPGKFFIIGGADGRFNVAINAGTATATSAKLKGVSNSLASVISQTQALTAAEKK